MRLSGTSAALSAAALVAGGLLAGQLAAGAVDAVAPFAGPGGRPPAPAGPAPRPTHFQHGSLRVDVVGADFDTVEAYYQDVAYRVRVGGARDLHRDGVFPSPGSDGLLAVRHGPAADRFIAVGWVSDGVVRVTEASDPVNEVLAPGRPVGVCWKTPWVLRLTQPTPDGERVCILRWAQGHRRWELLDPATQAWRVVTN